MIPALLLAVGLAAAPTTDAVALPEASTLLADPSAVGGVTRAESTPLGITLWLNMVHGPFPCAGKPWTDATTIVFVPRHLTRKKPMGLLVHFHGHDGVVGRKIVDHALREQVVESGRNVILVAPQGPYSAPDSSGGKLDEVGGFAQFCAELRRILGARKVVKLLGQQSLGSHPSWGRVALSAHSGGYRVLARVLTHGGVPIDEVWLFDALYGDVPMYRDWALQPARRLRSWFTRGAPEQLNRILLLRLRQGGASPLLEDPEGTLRWRSFCRADLVFVHTDLHHGKVPVGRSALRDALLCSKMAAATRTPPPEQPTKGARVMTVR